MWIAGIQQGALWKSVSPDGSLTYTFYETLLRNYPFWQLRTVAGIVFTIGMLFFVYNVMMTIRKGASPAASRA
jgi:cytochrome c oxidase cbb3-type subunit 1